MGSVVESMDETQARWLPTQGRARHPPFRLVLSMFSCDVFRVPGLEVGFRWHFAGGGGGGGFFGDLCI